MRNFEQLGRRLRGVKMGLAALLAGLALGLTACGGGATVEDSPSVSAKSAGGGASVLAQGDAGFQTLLHPVQPQTPANNGGNAPTTLTIHYQRNDGNTAGWQVHAWNAGKDPGWNQGWNPSGSDSFGAIYEIPLNAGSGEVGYLFHKGDWKDGGDQSYTLKAGKNEIWRREGDGTTYLSRPNGGAAPVPDLHTLRVHYKRFDANYAAWGLHLWGSNGMDVNRLPAGVNIGNWDDAVGFSQMPGYATGIGEVVFDIPVLNPKDDSGRTQLAFLIHGESPNQNDKDGRANDIVVKYAELSVSGGVGQIWLVQGDAKVYTSAPDLRRVSINDARAFWLDGRRIQWPAQDTGGVLKLYHSATAQLVVVKDEAVRGADGSITLESFSGSLDAAVAERFKWLPAGPRYQLPAAASAPLRGQVVLVQENAQGQVQNATTLQHAGALDDLHASAEAISDLGATLKPGGAQWKLWAPTASRVAVFVYPNGSGAAESVHEAAFDAATGSWTAYAAGNLQGKTYRYGVEVFVRGVGVVRNLVTDPYSLSLTADGKRSALIDLNDADTQPPGWNGIPVRAKVEASPDMSIYELHVRDFSAQDSSVPAKLRGKYAAFGERSSAGIKHLKALADAGLTDVHLLPVFDFASVPETGCLSLPIMGGPADTAQQNAVKAMQGKDCFNWGYDPQHFNAPEGSYASDASNPVARVREFRVMVQALNQLGLRVGMDVVYNHTSSSGQTERSVLDRVVPGYYHRYNEQGEIERSTCCENTATENRMMGKLMSDSVLVWARDYKISSFRFDLMGHQPRAVMEAMQARLKRELGREVQFLGEGWDFGEVANNRRFVQATQLSLNGSGIGTFNDRTRDAVRGSSFGEGDSFVANQGFVNGAWYDGNGTGGKSRGELMWMGDLIKAGLAGSIRSYEIKTHWDAQQRLDQLGGQTIGYVTQPGEVVNYVENHDNHTLFDLNAYRLPVSTSKEDRARVQMLAAALNTLSQGVPYFHAGVDTLRSKSGDRNSYDAGDWFNRIDWTYSDNFWATGLPLQGENGANWGVLSPRLTNPLIKPTPGDIAWTRDAFRDLLKIRASTTLLRLRTADDIKARLKFHNVGSGQEPTVLVGQVDGSGGYKGARFAELVYLVNVDKQDKVLPLDALKGKGYVLHPVQADPAAADARVRSQAAYDNATGAFRVPARSVVVFVR